MGKRLRSVRKLFDSLVRFKDMDASAKTSNKTTARSSRCPIADRGRCEAGRQQHCEGRNDSMGGAGRQAPGRFPALPPR